MKKLLLVRVFIAAIGVAVWGYGYRYDVPSTRLVAIGILAAAVLMRFVPSRWFGEE